MHPMGLKFVLKVFGRGVGGEPFLRKVSPDKYTYYLRRDNILTGLFYNLLQSAEGDGNFVYIGEH